MARILAPREFMGWQNNPILNYSVSYATTHTQKAKSLVRTNSWTAALPGDGAKKGLPQGLYKFHIGRVATVGCGRRVRRF